MRVKALKLVLVLGALAIIRPCLALSVIPIADDLALEPPECLSFTPDRIDCLVRTAKGNLVWVASDKGRWSIPQNLGGELLGPPSCVIRGPLGLNCFAVLRNGTLGQINFNGGRWSSWRSLGGRLMAGQPSCFAPQRDRISCFVTTATGGLAVKVWLGDSDWQEWRQLGGRLLSSPSCVGLSLDRAACFWRGAGGRFSAWLPNTIGPGGRILEFPQKLAEGPSCVALEADRVVCLARSNAAQLVQWRGHVAFAPVPQFDFTAAPAVVLGQPVCSIVGSRQIECAFLGPNGSLVRRSGDGTRWTLAQAISDVNAAGGKCIGAKEGSVSCLAVDRGRALRVVFSEGVTSTVIADAIGPPGDGVAEVPSPERTLPDIELKPDVLAAPSAVAGLPPSGLPSIDNGLNQQSADLSIIDVNDPVGDWYIFEAATGRSCRVSLTDVRVRGSRRLDPDPSCKILKSMDGVGRWTVEQAGIFFRDVRGRVFFRFQEAGPTALRAKWRKSGFVMLARDPRVFQGRAIAAQPMPATASGKGYVGVWRLTTARGRACTLRLTIDPDSAATRVRPEGCTGPIAQIDTWAVTNGSLSFRNRAGVSVARFDYVRGPNWRGRLLGGRRDMILTQQ